MRLKTLIALATIGGSLVGATAQLFAQGTAFTYQGRLNSGGSPVNGSYDLAFTLFNTNCGGSSSAGPVTNSATGVTNGLFTVTLDFGSGVFDGNARWLEIAVRTNGATGFATLAPRQPLMPTPYAIFAGTASSLSGTLPASQVSGVVPLAQLPAAVMTNYATGVSLSGSFTGNATTAATATNFAGGSGLYVVQTNGWYSANGIWHAETNSGQSLQDALNFAALYNPADAYMMPTFLTNGYAPWQWIIRLPYWAGGKFQIAAGEFCKPDGSPFWVSNQIMSSTWQMVGSEGTMLVANSNVIGMTISYTPNNIAAAYLFELDHLGILSKSNVCGVQVNCALAAQNSYVHDGYFTMYDFLKKATNGVLMEEPTYIPGPQGMVGLVIGGGMGSGTACRNLFYGLADGIVCPENGGTYISENRFFSIGQWMTNDSVQDSTLWTSTNMAPFVVSVATVLNAELSVGAGLIIDSEGQGFYDRNFFFEGRCSIYLGSSASDNEIQDNACQGVANPQIVAATPDGYAENRLLNNDANGLGGRPTVAILNWPFPYTITNFTLTSFTNSAANQSYSLATNYDDLYSGNNDVFAIWTNAVNTNWTVKFNDPNADDNWGLVIESNNVEIWNNGGNPQLLPNINMFAPWYDVNYAVVPGALNLAVVPIPTNLVPNTAYVSYLDKNLMVSNGTVFAKAFFGNGNGLTNLQPANIASGNLPATVTNTAPINGANILAGTVSSNALDAATKALLGTGSGTGTVANATTAGTATNFAGGSGLYIVQTNGWYAPSGMWHSETNSGQSLQDALNFAALYNPADAYMSPQFSTNGYAPWQWIIRLPYWVGGKFQIAAGEFCKPDGSPFWISNNIMTSSWQLVGSMGTMLVANSDVIGMTIHYMGNTVPAAYLFELDHLGIVSKSNICSIQVNAQLSAQNSYVHDCYFTMYDFLKNATNGLLMEEPAYIPGPQGMIGLMSGGAMGNGTVCRNKFYGLAAGMIAPEESTYVYENNFFNISTWMDTNGATHYSNLWTNGNTNDVVGDQSKQSSIYGAELSYGAALVINSFQKSYFARNFFFEGGISIYIGRYAIGNVIEDNFNTPVASSEFLAAEPNSFAQNQLLNNQVSQWVAITNWYGSTFPLTNGQTVIPVSERIVSGLSVSGGIVSGDFTGSFDGDGSALTGLQPANIASGNLPATVTNTAPINGANILAGTVSSNALDAATKALLGTGSGTGTVANATTAGTATNFAGGSGLYVVQTNGWYTPTGMWHAETNSGQSLQDALNHAALYKPADAYMSPQFYTNGFAPWQWIIRLPYWVGGKFQIAAGEYCKPDGSPFWISNNIMTSSWQLVGSMGTMLVANSNVIGMTIHYMGNTVAAAYLFELDHLGIVSKSNICSIQVNAQLSAQNSYVHDCYFTMYDFLNNATNGNLMEDPIYIPKPQGMVGLMLGGGMGNGTVLRNKFYGLATGMIAPEESTYVYENNFFSISTWMDTNGATHFSNLWTNSDTTDVVGDTSGNTSIYGAELSVGAALIINSSSKSFFDWNFFFEGGVSIYFGVFAGANEIKNNIFQPGGDIKILVASTNDNVSCWADDMLSNNGFFSAWGTLNWDGATFPITNTIVLIPTVNTLTSGLSESNGVLYASSFIGSGFLLTNLQPSNIASGNLPATVTNTAPVTLAQLPSAVLTNNQTGATLSGSFTGNGGGLTNIPVAAIFGGINTNILINGVTFYITNGIIMKIQ